MNKKSEPKVLVGCPTYKGMKYCIDKFLDRVRDLTYSNYETLMVDNSKDGEYFSELKKERGIKVVKDECQEESGMKRVISSRNRIIEYALENNCDYILMLDQDVIPPKEVITELSNCKKDIVSALYYNYFKSSGKIKILPCVWMPISQKEFEKMRKQINFPETAKSHESLRRHLTIEEAQSEKLFKVLIPAAGCLLLSRKVFEKVRYGLVDMTGIKADTSEDIYFFKKVREQGFESYCYTKIVCDHLIAGKFIKDAEGKLRHPLH